MLRIAGKALIDSDQYTALSLENNQLRRENERLRDKIAALKEEISQNRDFDAKTLNDYSILYQFHQKVLQSAVMAHKEIGQFSNVQEAGAR